jgi:glycine/D-amino acid oxidase-like deaminating enzyme
VRALPPRSQLGSVPLVGRLPPELGNPEERPWWLLVGLGARGLVYHAWLARQLARAALAGDESLLDPELRRWQQAAGRVEEGPPADVQGV